MIIVLKESVYHNGYMKKLLSFNCSEEVFIKKTAKWLEFKQS